MNIDGQHVLVTGGSQGIGTEIAKEFARRGGKVTVLGRNAERLAAVAAEIGGSSVALDLATCSIHFFRPCEPSSSSVPFAYDP